MKIQKRFVVSAVFILMALSISLSVYAQEAPRQPQENTFYFVSSEMSFDGKVVKGAPYSHVNAGLTPSLAQCSNQSDISWMGAKLA